MVHACIDDTVLSDFLAGRISADQATDVESHLATCSKCQRLAAGHSSRLDSLLAAARSAGASDPLEKEPELAVALSAIGRLRSPGSAGFDPTRAAAPEIHNYRLIEKLGEGGMGTVYRAVHVHLEKTVALKIMKADRSGNPQAVSRFEREMKAIGRLEHPHIVRALDAGEQGGVYFLVMEYVAGIDLDQLIRGLGPLPVADACEIARQAALGLAHAHEHNLVHRDVKPSNLMLSPEGQVKVLDLGLAQFQQSAGGGLDLTVEGQMIGTLLYMSPEQRIGGRNVDHRSDVFSLGVTLYCLLAGGLPLDRGQPAAMLPEIGQVRADIPPEVQSLLPKLLAPAPEDRIGSMSRVAELLKPLASGRPLTALLKKAQNRPTDRTALPPAILPTRSPPVHDAAAASTVRARQDRTVVAPTSSALLTVRKLATSRLTGWIAAGLACVALATIVIVNVAEPEPEPAHPIPGALMVVNGDPNDARLPDLMREKGIRAIGASGNVVHLQPGFNALSPGTYQLAVDHRDLQIGLSEIQILPSQEHRLEVVLPALTPPPQRRVSRFASIPDIPGPLIRFTGNLWYQGMPNEQRTPFILTLRAKDEQLVGKAKYRWIEVEVQTLTATGDYTETGQLLVDAEKYKSDQLLEVKEGWVTAESKSLEERLGNQFPGTQIKRLVIEYDRNDKLADRAKELNLFLPAERLSVQHVLVLLFGASIPNAPEPLRKSRALVESDSARAEERALFRGALCDVIRSGPIESLEEKDAKGYLIAVNPNVPFGLAWLFLANETLELKCGCEHSNYQEVPAPPDKTLAGEAQVLASLKREKPDPIGIALIPEADGALATYTGELLRDTQAKVAFDAEVRTAGTEVVNGVTLQALEIRALTYFPGKAPHHVEEGWIRFDANRYQQRDQFVIQEGWFQVQGETFRFDDKGDLLAVEDDLLVLGKPRLPSNRLGVHDVLGLLFDASLIATDTKNIRKGVTGVLRLTGQEPLHSETQAPLRGKPQVTADLYSVGKRTDKPVNYVICRSRSLPFDFYTVNLTLSLPESSFSITTALTNYEYSGTEPLLGNPQVFHGAALATSQKVKDKLRDPNVRVWRTAKDALFGEFAGTEESRTKGSRTAVFLQPDGTTALSDVKFLFLDELSKPDQDWVAAGRFWNDGKVRKRYPYVLRFGIENEWKVRRRSGTVEFDRLYGELDAADRKWIDRQEALRKR